MLHLPESTLSTEVEKKQRLYLEYINTKAPFRKEKQIQECDNQTVWNEGQ